MGRMRKKERDATRSGGIDLRERKPTKKTLAQTQQLSIKAHTSLDGLDQRHQLKGSWRGRKSNRKGHDRDA